MIRGRYQRDNQRKISEGKSEEDVREIIRGRYQRENQRKKSEIISDIFL
jgi:hypothetical protein